MDRKKINKTVHHLFFLHIFDLTEERIDAIAGSILTAAASLIGTSVIFIGFLFVIPNLSQDPNAKKIFETALFGLFASIGFLLSAITSFLALILHTIKGRMLSLWVSVFSILLGCISILRTIIEVITIMKK